MSHQPDIALELLAAWRGGSRPAGDRLYRTFDVALRRFFGAKAPPHEVDELVQQTWLALARDVSAHGAQGTERIHSSVRGYLFGIARHVLFHYYQHARAPGNFDPAVDSLESLTPSLSRQFSLQRRAHTLVTVLQQLPIELQLLAEARYIEGLNGPELAEMFGLPEGTVRSRLSRGRRLIQEAFERLGHEFGPDTALRS